MFAHYFARRRVRRAQTAFRLAYGVSCDATERQDTRAMRAARDKLCAAQHEQLAAENALAAIESRSFFGSAF